MIAILFNKYRIPCITKKQTKNKKPTHCILYVFSFDQRLDLTSIRHYYYNQGIYYCNVSFSNLSKLKL